VDKINPNKPEQIFAKISVDATTGCWNWTGHINIYGYGLTSYHSKTVQTHRFMYAWLIKPIPRGQGRDIPVLDHLCNNRKCCNPAHLLLVLPRENVMRSTAPPALNYKKGNCMRGHPLSARHPVTGRRRCYKCARLRERLKRLEVS
jgi:hypothetical protein